MDGRTFVTYRVLHVNLFVPLRNLLQPVLDDRQVLIGQLVVGGVVELGGHGLDAGILDVGWGGVVRVG